MTCLKINNMNAKQNGESMELHKCSTRFASQCECADNEMRGRGAAGGGGVRLLLLAAVTLSVAQIQEAAQHIAHWCCDTTGSVLQY
jgi:glycerate kinase